MDIARIHILVVDDLADMADTTAEMLFLWGYDATACSSGAMALDCARARRPVAVLLDLVMPRMDGFQFARAFRELLGCADVPLIAVSGYWSPAYSARAEEAGIGHYLLKPVDPDKLKAILGLVIQNRAIPSRLRIAKHHVQRLRSRLRFALTGLVPSWPHQPSLKLAH